MLKGIIPVFVVVMSLGSISAQTFIGKLNPFPTNTSSVLQVNDTVRILGIMINFQEDRDGATFGNGKFGNIYTSDYGNTILDPLPHSKAYFEAHLEFVKNYFDKVSGGKTIIEYFMLSDTFSVSQAMRNYAPEPNSDDFSTLAAFAREVWNIADAAYSNFDFSSYDIFTIFHAGVGRDVTLPGSIGNERDLPSVYLGLNTLKNILGEAFDGFPVSNGDFKITNSMIIPETESREVETFNGKILFELSINGLLVASVASHLGLPDLFNTETGLSAIGRFGLMDGQAIFAYGGTFPPEPSAWEKIYLGWAVPSEISPGDYNVSLRNHLAPAPAFRDTVILKVPINSSEYFLVENRQRDVHNDGAVVTYVLDGNTFTKVFTKDTTGFYSFDTDSINGVVIDVDEYDWAIPNLISIEDNTYDPKPGGGIVIWHIDEKIINEKIGENKINVDKDHRGVDVEEADGVQDIGESFVTVFGDEIIGEGFVEDFWYADNPSELYENKFSKDTRPNTNTNSGANSLITFSNFSGLGNRMSFKISYGDTIIKPIFITQLNTPLRINNLSHSSDLSFDVIVDSSLLLVSKTGVAELSGTFSKYKTASLEIDGERYTIGASGNIVRIYNYSNEQITSFSLSPNEIVTSSPVVGKSATDQLSLFIGTSAGRVLIYSLQNFPSSEIQISDSVDFNSSAIRKIASGDILLAATDSSFFLFPEILETPKILNSYTNSNNNSLLEIRDIVLDLNTPVILYGNNQIGIRHTDHSFTTFSISSSDIIGSFSMADLKNDGRNYILFISDNNLEAVNLQGVNAENFPFVDPLGIGFIGTPLAADFEGDGKAEIIACTKDGRIFAVDGGTGKVVNGFPISTGAELATVPVLFNYQGKASLAAVDVENNFYAWIIGASEGKMFWSEENGNNSNSSFVKAANNTANYTNQFFPENRIYNYPNPVYDNTTYIRYYVSEDSKINIKIFDLAGGFVAELNDNAIGGFDNETQWNVSDIQSGVYLARIEATGPSGKSESNIIKVAIIK